MFKNETRLMIEQIEDAGKILKGHFQPYIDLEQWVQSEISRTDDKWWRERSISKKKIEDQNQKLSDAVLITNKKLSKRQIKKLKEKWGELYGRYEDYIPPSIEVEIKSE